MRRRSYASPTFGVELTERVKSAWNSPVCADRVERSAEDVKAVPDGIILDDFRPRFVYHCGPDVKWKEKRKRRVLWNTGSLRVKGCA